MRWIAVSVASAPLVFLAVIATLAAPAGLLLAVVSNGDPAMLRFLPLALAGAGLGAVAVESTVKIPHAFRVRYRRRLRGAGARSDDVRLQVSRYGDVTVYDRGGELTPEERLGGPLGLIDRHPGRWLAGTGILLGIGVLELVVEVLLAG